MIATRRYGDSGPQVVLLHGGPGAPGTMAPVARALSDEFRVLEPLQRRSGDKPLTVARHVAELAEIIEAECPTPPALLGASWGAMLALAFAAAHPAAVGPIVLVGCGTFDLASRGVLQETIRRRLTPDLRRRLEDLEAVPNEDERLRAMGEALRPIYAADPLPAEPPSERFDARGFEQSWNDMVRLQKEGAYPAAFAAVTSPVLMLHGDFDPHPGRLIRNTLARYIPRLEYHELARCGHEPWMERSARDEFFVVLRRWLAAHIGTRL